MPLDLLLSIIAWTHGALATWYVAGVVGGVLILAAERLSRQADPSEADVKHAAQRYRQSYGENALRVIGDHMRAAGFVPDGRHRQFLKRVVGELQDGTIADDDRREAYKLL